MIFDVIVIGGGPAGVTAALRARELGASVALVERGRLGGTCTNDGCVPTRVLARAARLRRDMEQFADYGLNGAAHGEVDIARLLERAQTITYQIHEKKQLMGHLEGAGVRVFANAGEARFVDAQTIEMAAGAQLNGRKFILCAGGRARRLSFPGSDHALTHSDVWTMTRLPRSVVVVGGAATGCQLASIFAAFGARVWILETAPTLLSGEDEIVSRTLTAAFQRRGIEIVTGIAGVDWITRDGESCRAQYTHPNGAYVLEGDAVIMAVGWPGNADTLNLAAAGVQSERGYVTVDDTLRTSAPHIFAAGDLTGRMMLVQSASDEARCAADNAVLGTRRPGDHRLVPHGGFTDPEYGSVGLTESQARAIEPDCAVAIVPYTALDRAVIDGLTEGVCKLIVSRESQSVLGAHVVGEQAVEIVQLAAAGMAANVRVSQLAALELAYPTYSAIVGLAARQVMGDLGRTPLAPAWQALASRTASVVSEWERSDSHSIR